MDGEEVSTSTAKVSYSVLDRLPRCVLRCDRSSNNGGAGSCKLCSDGSSVLEVFIPFFQRKSNIWKAMSFKCRLQGKIKPTRGLFAYSLSEEQRHTPSSLLVERNLEGFGDLVFARVVQSRKEEDESLLGSRGITFTKYFDDLTNSKSDLLRPGVKI